MIAQSSLRRPVNVIALVAVFAALAADAHAQQQRALPSRALFGGASTDPRLTQSLDVNVSAAASYDSQAFDQTGLDPSTLSPFQRGGFYNALSGTLNYSWNGRRMQVGATGGGSGRYYTKDNNFLLLNEFASGGFFAAPNPRLTIAVNQSVSYSPPYFNALLPGFDAPSLGASVGAGSDYSVGRRESLLYDTTATVAHTFSPRSSFAVLGNYRFADQSFDSASTLRSYGIGGRYMHSLSKNLALRLGYIYREGRYAGTETTILHDIDAGVDYQRALSFSKHTKVNFRLGSLILNSSPKGVDARSLRYGVTGNAGLTQDIGRTWRARIVYDRGVNFSEAFQNPVFVDSVRATTEGLINKRIDFRGEGAVSIGDLRYSATAGADSNVRNYQALARLRYALASWLALYSEYVYYKYDLGKAVELPTGISPTWNRTSIRAGATLLAPLLKR